jgi:hypothetical protein
MHRGTAAAGHREQLGGRSAVETPTAWPDARHEGIGLGRDGTGSGRYLAHERSTRRKVERTRNGGRVDRTGCEVPSGDARSRSIGGHARRRLIVRQLEYARAVHLLCEMKGGAFEPRGPEDLRARDRPGSEQRSAALPLHEGMLKPAGEPAEARSANSRRALSISIAGSIRGPPPIQRSLRAYLHTRIRRSASGAQRGRRAWRSPKGGLDRGNRARCASDDVVSRDLGCFG